MTPLRREPATPLRLTYGMVRDGIVTGSLERTLITCQVCGARTCGVRVTGYDLPEEVPWESTIINIQFRQESDKEGCIVVVYLGIGCGCYAKFHRQVAHIRDSVEEGRDFPET